MAMEHSDFEKSVSVTGQDTVTSLSLPCALNITVAMAIIHEKLQNGLTWLPRKSIKLIPYM